MPVKPLAIATAAGVYGEPNEVTAADLAGKLDKATATSTYQEVYGKTTAGVQQLLAVAAAAVAATIALRDANGRIAAADGAAATDVATVGQLGGKLDASAVKQDVDPEATGEVPSSAAVMAAIDAAVASVTGTGFTAVVATALPSSGESGVFYFIGPKGGPYDEYIWVAGETRFELIGHTSIDLSGYLLKEVASATAKMVISQDPGGGLGIAYYDWDETGETWAQTGEFRAGSADLGWDSETSAYETHFAVFPGGLHVDAASEDGESYEFDVGALSGGLQMTARASDGVEVDVRAGDGQITLRAGDHELVWDSDGTAALDGVPLYPVVEGALPAQPQTGVLYLVNQTVA
ncbi:MAG: hypothetical protein LBD77_02165 [Bifidobacteriaceae bacterium]|jgi:hypothetical protein|nr:hypothetical protein [Bifidobacteriaceae bacterium]